MIFIFFKVSMFNLYIDGSIHNNFRINRYLSERLNEWWGITMDTFVIPQHNLRNLDLRTESPQTIMPHNDNDNFLYY